MTPTRLCITTNEYLPLIGGIQMVVSAQNRRLHQRDYEPFVVTPRIQTPKRYFFDGTRVECYESLNTGFRVGIPYAIPSASSFKTFLKAAKSSDIVHSHGHPYLTSLIMGKLAKKCSKPFVLTQHNTFIRYDNVFDKIERLNDLVVGKETLKEADIIIAVSEATKNYVLSLGAERRRVKVLHNGVDLVHFRPIPGKREEMRGKLRVSKNAVIVLTVRRLVYKNGIDTLIEAAKLVVTRNPNIHFIVAGTGTSQIAAQTRIRQLGIENNFRLAGLVSDYELPFYYNAADFFVLPSKSGEGLPLVALEAMACGLPVIATNVGGIGEILTENCGQLLPPNAPALLANAILDYSNRNLSLLKSEIRAVTEEKHSWEKNVDSLVEIYKGLV